MLNGSIPIPNDVKPSKADMVSKTRNANIVAGQKKKILFIRHNLWMTVRG